MVERSDDSQSSSSVERVEKEIVVSPDLKVRIPEEMTEEFAAELERRLTLERDRLTAQEVRAERSRTAALGTLGSLTAAASIAGLSASVAAVPALAPALIVAVTYFVSKLFSENSERAERPTPPVLAAAGEELARDREIIRCFSPHKPLPLTDGGSGGGN